MISLKYSIDLETFHEKTKEKESELRERDIPKHVVERGGLGVQY